MTNARSIIEQAARKIHVLGRGVTLSAEEAQDGLTALNNLLSTFSAEGGVIYTQTRQSFTSTGAESYTIGSGGDFNTTAPVSITALYVSDGGTDHYVKQGNATDFARVQFKNVTGEAEFFYYDNNRPLARVFFHPKPSAGHTINLWSLKGITSFADLTTDYTLPEGVESMLVYNLAVVWAPEYEKEASATVKTEAIKTKNAVMGFAKRNNYPTSNMDSALVGGTEGNVYSGWNG